MIGAGQQSGRATLAVAARRLALPVGGVFAGLVLSLAVATPVAGVAAEDRESPRESYRLRHRSLDAAEQQSALVRALGRATSELRRRRPPGAGTARIEVLRVERQRTPKGEAPQDYRRRANVYFYDYDEDHLCRVVVDLEADQVVSLQVSPSVQLPLTHGEVLRALDLLFADAQAAARLGAEFQRITGRALRDRARELDVAGFVYRAEAMPDANSADTARCGVHRCAQLLIRTRDQVSLELPIVDLSRERVLQTRWFGGRPPEAAAPPGHEGHDHAH